MSKVLAALAALVIVGNGTQCLARDMYAVYNRIGNRAVSRHNTALAQVMFARALEQAEKYGEKDNRVVDAAIRLANLYADQDEYVLAQPLYQRLVGIAERSPQFSVTIASALDHYAQLEQRTHRGDRADSTRQLAATLRANGQQTQLGATGTSM